MITLVMYSKKTVKEIGSTDEQPAHSYEVYMFAIGKLKSKEVLSHSMGNHMGGVLWRHSTFTHVIAASMRGRLLA